MNTSLRGFAEAIQIIRHPELVSGSYWRSILDRC